LKRRLTEEERLNYLRRLRALEKHLVLPARVAVLVACLIILWPIMAGAVIVEKELALFKWSAVAYATLCVAYWVYLFKLADKPWSHTLLKTAVFASALTDTIFLGLLFNAAKTETLQQLWLLFGPEASLFWAFCALIVRSTLLFTEAGLQTVLSFASIVGYVAPQVFAFPSLGLRDFSDVGARELLFRVIVLVLVTICSSAIYSLRQRRQRELDEARERTIRSHRLDMAGMLAAQVAHELKNPLSIMTNAAFLLKKSKQGLDPKACEQVDIIQEEVNRADQIVRELLGYGKLAQALIEAVAVNDSLEDSLVALKNEIESRKIEVNRHYSFDMPYLFIDATQIRQVFTNLLLNACEAIQDGGSVTVTTNYTTHGFIEVFVADTGKGIEPQLLHDIFKPFFTTKEKGTGMGLSIVQSVVRAYGGDIGVESELGKGTTFRVRFPTRMATQLRESKSQGNESPMKAALKTIKA
jgi:signal transduction histidine kinase